MNKRIPNKLTKIITPIMIILVLVAVLFVLTSCKSDYRKTLEGEPQSSANGSTGNTIADIGANTTGHSETSESGTDTVATTETTSESANPEAQQIIEVTASSGGYSPRKIEAKAGIPTILVIKSEGAYGCERAFNIPDLNVSEILPENGQTEFDLGAQSKGTKLVGVCSMGMYYFQIFFN
jgi:hypothetical protein